MAQFNKLKAQRVFSDWWHHLNENMSPGGSDGKESACNAGDLGLIPGLGRYPGEGNGYPLQYSCLGNSTGRGVWWVTVHGPTKSQMWLSTRSRTARKKTKKLDLNLTKNLDSVTSWQEIQRTKNMSQNATRMPSAKSKLRDSTDERPSFLYRSTTSVNQLGTVNLNCTKTDTNWK